MGGEGPSVVVRWLTTITLLLWMLGVPLIQSSVRLLTCVVIVGAVLLLVMGLSLRLGLPVGRRCLGNQIWELPPIGLSSVASGL